MCWNLANTCCNRKDAAIMRSIAHCDLVGTWRMANGDVVEITEKDEKTRLYRGEVIIEGNILPLLWNNEGISMSDTKYDLVRMKQSKEDIGFTGQTEIQKD